MSNQGQIEENKPTEDDRIAFLRDGHFCGFVSATGAEIAKKNARRSKQYHVLECPVYFNLVRKKKK